MRLPRTARRVLRRYASALPPGARSLIRTLGRIGPGRPSVGPPGGTVLILAAHPDDESIGCGGTIAVLADGRTQVSVAIATDGDALGVSQSRRDLAARRRAEGEEACRVLGVGPPRYLGLPDGELDEAREDLAAALTGLLAEVRPSVVLLPWFGDAHDDHRALNRALADAGLPSDVAVWGYEIWSPVPANRLVDITAVLGRKQRAIAAHTADASLDMSVIFGLNRYRTETARLDGTHAEAFLELPADAYVRCVRGEDG